MRQSAFSVIELLLTLVIVILLATAVMKSLRKQQAPATAATQGFEGRLRDVMEQNGPIELTASSDTFLEGKGARGTFRITLSGSVPQQNLEMVESNGKGIGLDHVAGARFTIYDGEDHFLSDHPSAEELKKARRVKFEIEIHDTVESPNNFVNDRIHGVDLDGHPENGVANVHERTFGIILPN